MVSRLINIQKPLPVGTSMLMLSDTFSTNEAISSRVKNEGISFSPNSGTEKAPAAFENGVTVPILSSE